MKKLLCMIFTLALVFSMTPTASASAPIIVNFNGSPMTFDTEPIAVNNRTLVPMRAIFEKLGYTVVYKSETGNIYAYKDSTEALEDAFVMRVGDSKVYECTTSTTPGSNYETQAIRMGAYLGKSDSDYVTIDQAPIAQNNRTLVPLRFISERAGCTVTWDGNTSTVMITTQTSQTTYTTTAKTDRNSILDTVYNDYHKVSIGGTAFSNISFGKREYGDDSVDYNPDFGMIAYTGYTLIETGVEKPGFLNGMEAYYVEIVKSSDSQHVLFQLPLNEPKTLYVHFSTGNGQGVFDTIRNTKPQDVMEAYHPKKIPTETTANSPEEIDQNVVDVFLKRYWTATDDSGYVAYDLQLIGGYYYECKTKETAIGKYPYVITMAERNNAKYNHLYGDGYYMELECSHDNGEYLCTMLLYAKDSNSDALFVRETFFHDILQTSHDVKYIDYDKRNASKPLIAVAVGDTVKTAGYFNMYVGTVEAIDGENIKVNWYDVRDAMGLGSIVNEHTAAMFGMDKTVNPYIEYGASTWIPKELLFK